MTLSCSDLADSGCELKTRCKERYGGKPSNAVRSPYEQATCPYELPLRPKAAKENSARTCVFTTEASQKIEVAVAQVQRQRSLQSLYPDEKKILPASRISQWRTDDNAWSRVDTLKYTLLKDK